MVGAEIVYLNVNLNSIVNVVFVQIIMGLSKRIHQIIPKLSTSGYLLSTAWFLIVVTCKLAVSYAHSREYFMHLQESESFKVDDVSSSLIDSFHIL